MPSRRDFLVLAAVVFAPIARPGAAPWAPQGRDQRLTTVTLVIDGMT